MLTDVHKMKRMGAVLEFLLWFEFEGNDFMESIVTGDETLVCHMTTESKKSITAMEAHWFPEGQEIQDKLY